MAKTADVAVIDYGMGNLHSVAKALQHVAPEAEVRVSDDVSVIRNARRVVYPGVGAIRDCMAEVHRRGLAEVIVESAASKPLLGICVGMQGLM
ncbi:MAG: imidazole glycerol phosphate synthase subunit HisH, partial [Pseudomonadales bacterium]|nr:imidazole glycerol phosphate synthase subunit HisH [Gammaproteobacteria bacterium]NNL57346.1 imidazole glycerol phosphate synthase subunit HisH [Pseudomonadales bacterium]